MGTDPGPLLERTAQLLFEHSLFNGHPRFFGYITASPAPIGMLGDFLAAAVNPNVGAWTLSPAATEIESPDRAMDRRAHRLSRSIAAGCSSAAATWRTSSASWRRGPRRPAGTCASTGVFADSARRLRVYASAETHTWIQKAADLAGLGTASIRWIPTDDTLRMDVAALRRQIEADAAAGDVPCLVVGTAGSVSTGAVDPLPRDRRAVQGARRLVPRRRRVRRVCRGRPRGARRPARPEPGRFRRGRSAQVAVRAARGRLRARARSGDAATRRSPTTRPTTTSTSVRPTTSTTARRTRAASVPSRCGSRCGRSGPRATAR